MFRCRTANLLEVTSLSSGTQPMFPLDPGPKSSRPRQQSRMIAARAAVAGILSLHAHLYAFCRPEIIRIARQTLTARRDGRALAILSPDFPQASRTRFRKSASNRI